MTLGTPLRTDYNADNLRRLSRCSSDSKQTRRLLALALIYDGSSRCEAARHANVDVQSIRDWALRFNAEGPDGVDRQEIAGTPPRLNAAQRAAPAGVVEDGPVPGLDGIVRWRLCDLVGWLYAEYAITVGKSTVSRMLHDMGYRKLSARPRHHAQDPEAGPVFKKNSRPAWRRSGASFRSERR